VVDWAIPIRSRAKTGKAQERSFGGLELKIKKPSEHGFRLEIESRADSKAEFLTLIASSIASDLGSYAFSCAKDKEKMWIRYGVFPRIAHPLSGK
jgi:hypothetical protein